MSTNSPGTGRTDETGLGWPLRPRISRLLGWPFRSRFSMDADGSPVGGAVSRETDFRSGAGEANEPADADSGDQRSTGDLGAAAYGPEPAGQRNQQPHDATDADGPRAAASALSVGGVGEDRSGDECAEPEVVQAPHPGDSAVVRPDGSNVSEALIATSGTGSGDAVPEVKPRRARLEEPASPASPPPVDVDEGTTGPVSRGTGRRVDPMLAPAETRTIVVANQKGGVGKTTTSVNLAAGLALGGLNVLVVDLDPQGNASTALGVEHGQGVKGTYEVLIDGDEIGDLVVDSPEAPHLRVLPATVDLAGAEIELVSMVARENKLKRALRSYLVDHPTDYVLLDCPPSLGLLTLNALVAAGEVLIPIQCEYYALEGVSQLMNTIELVMAELNEDLQLSTVLLTMFDGRTRLASQVADEVRSYFSEQTLPTVIPRSVRISEAPSYGQTVITYHPDSAGAVSYLEAARELARRGAKEKV